MAYPIQKLGVVAAFLGLAATAIGVGGCQKNYDTPQKCSATSDCTAIVMKYDGQLPDNTVCCSGFCIVTLPNNQPTGCESGYRYLTTEPFVGDCVDSVAACFPDMSMPVSQPDMTQVGDAG